MLCINSSLIVIDTEFDDVKLGRYCMTGLVVIWLLYLTVWWCSKDVMRSDHFLYIVMGFHVFICRKYSDPFTLLCSLFYFKYIFLNFCTSIYIQWIAHFLQIQNIKTCIRLYTKVLQPLVQYLVVFYWAFNWFLIC